MKRLASVLVILTGLPLFGLEGSRADLREVHVRVLADEEVRAAAGWSGRISSQCEAVSGVLERLFGIRLVIGGYGEWTTADDLDSLELLLEALDASASKEGCDVIVALTGQGSLKPHMLGYSHFKEGLILLLAADSEPGLERVLLHEWGHMFGAAHVINPESVMHRLLRGRTFDALNARIIRLCKNRTFNGIDFPIPKDARRQALEVYREICEANLKAASGIAAEAVALGHEIRAVIDERGRNETFFLDDAYFLSAQLHLEEREYEQALEACRAALKLNPDNLETQNLVGIIARRQGRIDEAIAVYEKILDKKPRSARFLYNEAIAQAKRGETDEALDLYRRAVELKPNFAEAWNNIGEIGLRAGRVEEAEKAFRKALAFNDNFALAHSNLAEVYVRKKEFGQAQAELDLALRTNAGLPGPHNVRGNLFYQQGRTAEAKREYEKALEIDPGYEKAHYNLGLCYFDEGKLPEAVAHLSKAIELAPRLAEAHASLGYGLLRSGRVKEGIAELRAAQDLGHVSGKTHLNLSYALLLQGDYESALAEARLAIELEPALAMAYNNLGVAAMKKGAVEEAARAFEKAVELDPKAKEALVNLGSLRTVLGRRKDALALFLQASELDPKDGVLHNNIAVLYFQEGSIQEAWNHTQKALALGAKVDPTFLEALYKARRRGPCAG